MRKCGVLLPISSLPSPYGIGTFGKEAYQWVDFLKATYQSIWQILPLGPTSYGDSPYQTFSTFAGNAYYIDFALLIQEGLLLDEELVSYRRHDALVDYEYQYLHREGILYKAYVRFDKTNAAYQDFCKTNAFWLEDYSTFMTIKRNQNGLAFLQWPIPYKKHEVTLPKIETEFDKFIQYIFHKQWMALKQYANQQGILIVGDLPIYVALDSADVWSHPEYFQLDEERQPTFVAGCPPDAFSEEGQLWGNPLYKYDWMEKDGYHWWGLRVQNALAMYDIVRIDHFRGFEAYYAIPAGSNTAKEGKWIKGPGMKLFQCLEASLGKLPMIAEDLGFLTEAVHQLLKDTGFPGMKVLQFAYDGTLDNAYLPNHYPNHCVVYTGTHDNLPTKAWANQLSDAERRFWFAYLRITDISQLPSALVEAAILSVADTAIIPIQDYLELDMVARINTPSTLGGNWIWRLSFSDLTNDLIKRMRALAICSNRINL